MSLKTFTLTFVGLLTTFVVLFAEKTIFSLVPLCLFALFLWYSAGLVKSDD